MKTTFTFIKYGLGYAYRHKTAIIGGGVTLWEVGSLTGVLPTIGDVSQPLLTILPTQEIPSDFSYNNPETKDIISHQKKLNPSVNNYLLEAATNKRPLGTQVSIIKEVTNIPSPGKTTVKDISDNFENIEPLIDVNYDSSESNVTKKHVILIESDADSDTESNSEESNDDTYHESSAELQFDQKRECPPNKSESSILNSIITNKTAVAIIQSRLELQERITIVNSGYEMLIISTRHTPANHEALSVLREIHSSITDYVTSHLDNFSNKQKTGVRNWLRITDEKFDSYIERYNYVSPPTYYPKSPKNLSEIQEPDEIKKPVIVSQSSSSNRIHRSSNEQIINNSPIEEEDSHGHMQQQLSRDNVNHQVKGKGKFHLSDEVIEIDKPVIDYLKLPEYAVKDKLDYVEFNKGVIINKCLFEYNNQAVPAEISDRLAYLKEMKVDQGLDKFENKIKNELLNNPNQIQLQILDQEDKIKDEINYYIATTTDSSIWRNSVHSLCKPFQQTPKIHNPIFDQALEAKFTELSQKYPSSEQRHLSMLHNRTTDVMEDPAYVQRKIEELIENRKNDPNYQLNVIQQQINNLAQERSKLEAELQANKLTIKGLFKENIIVAKTIYINCLETFKKLTQEAIEAWEEFKRNLTKKKVITWTAIALSAGMLCYQYNINPIKALWDTLKYMANFKTKPTPQTIFDNDRLASITDFFKNLFRDKNPINEPVVNSAKKIATVIKEKITTENLKDLGLLLLLRKRFPK